MYINTTIKQRVFIVGCPRSGTTLLQGMLATHSRIRSFPETHFFTTAYPQNPLRRWITWPALNVRSFWKPFLTKLNRLDLLKLTKNSVFSRDYASKFVSLLDFLTIESQKDIWVEKTPRHLHVIDQIKNVVPNAKFIHIVRDGPSVVASIYKVTNEKPSLWTQGRSRIFSGYTVQQCVDRWNKDILITTRYRDSSNHIIVNYKSLVASPTSVLLKISDFLKIDYEQAMEYSEESFHQIVDGDEVWKANNAKPIQQIKSKFEDVFSLSEQKYVLDNLVKPFFTENTFNSHRDIY